MISEKTIGALVVLALVPALGGCAQNYDDADLVLDYCSTAISRAQEEGCDANVTADDIRGYAANGSQNAKDALWDVSH